MKHFPKLLVLVLLLTAAACTKTDDKKASTEKPTDVPPLSVNTPPYAIRSTAAGRG